MRRAYALIRNVDFIEDFRITANIGCAFAALFLLTPFAINNFIQGRVILDAASLMVIAVLDLNAVSIIRGRIRPTLAFMVLVPLMIGALFLTKEFETTKDIGSRSNRTSANTLKHSFPIAAVKNALKTLS